MAALAWSGTPEELLSACREIERRGGRSPSFRNGPREIDLDILDLGGLVIRSARLVLPHPRLSGRRFVLAPLAEIAPRWRHPVSGETARRLLDALPEHPAARRFEPEEEPARRR